MLEQSDQIKKERERFKKKKNRIHDPGEKPIEKEQFTFTSAKEIIKKTKCNYPGCKEDGIGGVCLFHIHDIDNSGDT